MKFFRELKKLSFALILCSLFAISGCIRNKDDGFFNDDPEFADSNRNPIINIHMDDHDSDPINFRRFDGERKTYNLRVNELREKYENEKKGLTHLITIQMSKIAQLTEVADATTKKLDYLIPLEVTKIQK